MTTIALKMVLLLAITLPIRPMTQSHGTNNTTITKPMYLELMLIPHIQVRLVKQVLDLDKIGAQLTTLSQQQADYINVPVEGPYKPEHYRY